MTEQLQGGAIARPRRLRRRSYRTLGPLAFFSLLLVALTACGGAATATLAPAPSASGAASVAPSSAAQASAAYTGQETFVGRGVATAVGSANGLTGALVIDKTNPSTSTIEQITIDISKLASDSGQRDNRIRREWLESNKYPTATFVTKRLEGQPTTPYTDGQELTFRIIGDLTIRTTTKEVTFEAKGTIVGDTFTGTATTNFNMTDFGFDPPDIAGVLKSENAVKLDLAIEAKR